MDFDLAGPGVHSTTSPPQDQPIPQEGNGINSGFQGRLLFSRHPQIYCPSRLDYRTRHGLPVSTVYTTIIRHPTFCCSLQFSSFLTIGTIPAKPITCSRGQIRGPPRFLGTSVTVKKFQLLAKPFPSKAQKGEILAAIEFGLCPNCTA